MEQSKICDICNKTFTRPTGESYARWANRIVCSAKCGFRLQTKRAAMKTERCCIYCDRMLPVNAFRPRGNGGLPLSYCRDCGLVKGRVRYRVNGKKKSVRKRPWNPGKRERAEALLNSAIRRNKIKRQPCEICGARAQAHHPDYDRPLDVRWLCSIHHGMAHWKPVDTPILEEAKQQIANAIRARTGDQP